ncbi:hypothetical protein B0O80DRAFT_439258 [Mortierella sp. GBAus27b]|nr:hypothetical protein BGX31_006663 [Mortierella sp. GBA43]KAI8360404.1 hypothetical protein B0O80DRAFT_439258 [Mortierella sp. GBAus27b]
MSDPLLDLSSRDELISNLLTGNKSSDEPKETPSTERKTFRVQSDLIGRLEDFLPKIKEANAKLEEQFKADPKSVDIENVDEKSGEQYIEMNLGLGVFDLKRDVKEEDIIINPSELGPSTAAVKPGIVVLGGSEDTEEDDPSDSDKESSSK